MTCMYKDPETGWCKLHSDWSSPMPAIEYCVGGPCPDERFHTNADRIRGMSDEELANELTRNPPIPCRMCEYWNREQCNCFAPNDFTCTTGYAEALTLDWLQQPAETEGRNEQI